MSVHSQSLTPHPGAGRPIGRALRVLCVVTLPLLLLALLLGSRWFWVPDLLMSGYWWVWLLSLLVACALALPARRVLPLISLVAILGCAWPMVSSRSLWIPREVSATQDGDVSVLVFNSGMRNTAREDVLPFVLDQDADIAVVLEPVWKFYTSVTVYHETDGVYPGVLERATEDGNARILVLSRWAISRFDNEPLANIDGLVCRVHRPEEEGGEFVVVATHPHSPRSQERWSYGNASLRRVADRVEQLIADEHRVVLGADLNAPPGSLRDRILRERGGVSRGKPLIGRWGSFPASWGIGRIAIDDLWCSPDLEIRSWRTLHAPGSDHRAVHAVVSVLDDFGL